MTPIKYRKKPVVIEALWFDGDNVDEAREFGFQAHIHVDPVSGRLTIPTLEGDMTVDAGDYIIRGVAGEFYPCKPDIFNKTYEPVND